MAEWTPDLTFTKDPYDRYRYIWDWSSLLAGAQIVPPPIFDLQSGLTLYTYALDESGTLVYTWVDGGTPDPSMGIANYTFSCSIVTNEVPLRRAKRTITIQVQAQ